MSYAVALDTTPSAPSTREASTSNRSTPLRWYLRVLFRLQPEAEPCRPVSKFIFWHPVTSAALRDPPARWDLLFLGLHPGPARGRGALFRHSLSSTILRRISRQNL